MQVRETTFRPRQTETALAGDFVVLTEQTQDQQLLEARCRNRLRRLPAKMALPTTLLATASGTGSSLMIGDRKQVCPKFQDLPSANLAIRPRTQEHSYE